MLLFLLGGSIAFAAGLLATASYTDGTLVAFKTTALVMGWLFVGAILIAWFARGLRRATFGEVSAATVTFISGIAVLYIAYFEWSEAPPIPIRHAAAAVAAEVLPIRQVSYQVIEAPVYKPIVVDVPPAPKKAPTLRKTLETSALSTPPAADPCSEKLGVSWIVCREQARLEYCEGRQADEATCPSAIPYSPPG